MMMTIRKILMNYCSVWAHFILFGTLFDLSVDRVAVTGSR